MAGKIVKATSATVTSSTAAGYATIASTTGWYAGAKGYLTKPATATVSIVITEIVSSTVLGVRIVSDDPRGVTSGVSNSAPNYGRSDISAYSGGTGVIYQNDQVIYNPNDNPLT